MENARSVTVNIPNGNSSQKVTFHQSKGIGIPLLKGLDSGLMDKVNQAHIKILPYEQEIHQWLGTSEKNAQLFLADPIQAMESANIGIPKDILSELKNVSQLVLTTLKK